MEWHIRCDKKEIARYVFCPGDHVRAKKIADQFEKSRLVSDSRGYMVYSGFYQGVFMTSCGTGMGGPTVAIALEELAHMGTDTFIRVGSCGVFQSGQKPGDVIISSGCVRGGGTGNGYLPLTFPAVPNFNVLQQLVASAKELHLPVTVGVGVAHDLFYSPHSDNERSDLYKKAGLVSIEMESDTLFLAGMYRGWRTGAIFTSDGTPDKIKPESGEADFRKGEMNSILIALHAMRIIAESDK
jgi:uridine phosphorylase